MSELTERELPRYQCHKKVWALKIKDLQPAFDVNGTEPRHVWMMFPEEEGYAGFEVSHEYIEKHQPKIGGYYIQYADGYESYSPSEVFEAGYTKI